MVELANAKKVVPTHGDEQKFEMADELVIANGSDPLRLSSQDVVGGKRGEEVDWLRQEEEFRILGREVFPGDFFWRRRYTEQPEIPMPFILTGPVGDIAQKLEEAAHKNRNSTLSRRPFPSWER